MVFLFTFSVGEPARNKHYRQAISPKAADDVIDSYACGRFAVTERPPATREVPEPFQVLREVASRLESQARQTTRTSNALHNLMSRVFPELATLVGSFQCQYLLELLAKYPTPEKLGRARRESLLAIRYLKKGKTHEIQAAAKRSVGSLRGEIAEQLVRDQVDQIRRSQQAEKRLENLLLEACHALPESPHRQVETIPGIGSLTAAVLVAKIVSLDRFETKGKLVSYFGVFPERNTSGTDKYGNPVPLGTMEMSRQGCDLVRHYLWMATLSAVQCNPAIRALYARLRTRGKRGDVALGHCMRKLLHLVFAVWKTDRPFDPNHYPWDKAATRQAAQQETAGRKRDMPEKEAITAANSKLKAAGTTVKQIEPAPSSSQDGWVDFAWLRQQITLEQLLSQAGCLDGMSKRGSQRRGRCPIHGQPGDRNRSFSADLKKNVFQCFDPSCGVHGNVLDFWAAWRRLPLREAALDLAATFHLRPSPNREEEPVSKKRSSASSPRGARTMT